MVAQEFYHMIVIIDYGMGNLGSIKNMLRWVGEKSEISSDKNVIANAEKLILPGVGAFDNGMKNIRKRGLIPVINRKVKKEKIPVLGICLGVQLMSRKSEEGRLPGLGWMNCETVRFSFEKEMGLEIPHMGWNTVRKMKRSRLMDDLTGEVRFYFVHSYHLVCRDPKDILMQTRYGIDFTSAVEKGNILGVQFHPEKSHRFGMTVLKNFAALY
jgi:glutamine amidotransferase